MFEAFVRMFRGHCFAPSTHLVRDAMILATSHQFYDNA
jgi:hypothetical protein